MILSWSKHFKVSNIFLSILQDYQQMHGTEVEENSIFQQAKKKASHLKNRMNYFNLISKKKYASSF